MTKKVLKDKQDFAAFAEENFSKDQLENFKSGKVKRPESYPCIAICCDNGGNDIEYITLQELLRVELDVLDLSETGIVLMKIDNMETHDPEELETLHQGLKNLGLSGLLIDHNDEVKELSHQGLVDTANQLVMKSKLR